MPDTARHVSQQSDVAVLGAGVSGIHQIKRLDWDEAARRWNLRFADGRLHSARFEGCVRCQACFGSAPRYRAKIDEIAANGYQGVKLS